MTRSFKKAVQCNTRGGRCSSSSRFIAELLQSEMNEIPATWRLDKRVTDVQKRSRMARIQEVFSRASAKFTFREEPARRVQTSRGSWIFTSPQGVLVSCPGRDAHFCDTRTRGSSWMKMTTYGTRDYSLWKWLTDSSIIVYNHRSWTKKKHYCTST